ncbi:MAG: ATP-binding cassette domain-containing protein [Myxococcota bacterium]
MKALDLQAIGKSYGPVVALRDVSFSVEPGEIIGLLGPNGAGKTTLMKILTGYLQADEGRALVNGLEVGTNALEVQAGIGYLPENAPLYRDLTVAEYLLLMAELRSIPQSDRGRLLSAAVEATGLRSYLDRRIDRLSKGYRQRVGIAQAILHEPKILILDEPTSGLDPTQIAEIRDLIRSLSSDATVLLSTHILSEVEMTCRRVIMITNGRVRADAMLDELKSASAAYVSVDAAKEQSDVRGFLSSVKGVTTVQEVGAERGTHRYRVSGEGNEDLCPAIFDALKSKSWRVSEIRSDARSLESVYRELAESPVDGAGDEAPEDAPQVEGAGKNEKRSKEARA